MGAINITKADHNPLDTCTECGCVHRDVDCPDCGECLICDCMCFDETTNKKMVDDIGLSGADAKKFIRDLLGENKDV